MPALHDDEPERNPSKQWVMGFVKVLLLAVGTVVLAVVCVMLAWFVFQFFRLDRF